MRKETLEAIKEVFQNDVNEDFQDLFGLIECLLAAGSEPKELLMKFFKKMCNHGDANVRADSYTLLADTDMERLLQEEYRLILFSHLSWLWEAETDATVLQEIVEVWENLGSVIVELESMPTELPLQPFLACLLRMMSHHCWDPDADVVAIGGSSGVTILAQIVQKWSALFSRQFSDMIFEFCLSNLSSRDELRKDSAYVILGSAFDVIREDDRLQRIMQGLSVELLSDSSHPILRETVAWAMGKLRVSLGPVYNTILLKNVEAISAIIADFIKQSSSGGNSKHEISVTLVENSCWAILCLAEDLEKALTASEFSATLLFVGHQLIVLAKLPEVSQTNIIEKATQTLSGLGQLAEIGTHLGPELVLWLQQLAQGPAYISSPETQKDWEVRDEQLTQLRAGACAALFPCVPLLPPSLHQGLMEALLAVMRGSTSANRLRMKKKKTEREKELLFGMEAARRAILIAVPSTGFSQVVDIVLDFALELGMTAVAEEAFLCMGNLVSEMSEFPIFAGKLMPHIYDALRDDPELCTVALGLIGDVARALDYRFAIAFPLDEIFPRVLSCLSVSSEPGDAREIGALGTIGDIFMAVGDAIEPVAPSVLQELDGWLNRQQTAHKLGLKDCEEVWEENSTLLHTFFCACTGMTQGLQMWNGFHLFAQNQSLVEGIRAMLIDTALMETSLQNNHSSAVAESAISLVGDICNVMLQILNRGTTLSPGMEVLLGIAQSSEIAALFAHGTGPQTLWASQAKRDLQARIKALNNKDS